MGLFKIRDFSKRQIHLEVSVLSIWRSRIRQSMRRFDNGELSITWPLELETNRRKKVWKPLEPLIPSNREEESTIIKVIYSQRTDTKSRWQKVLLTMQTTISSRMSVNLFQTKPSLNKNPSLSKIKTPRLLSLPREELSQIILKFTKAMREHRKIE